MTLWDIIRDFFVQYIFGGCDSQGVLHNGGTLGSLIFTDGNDSHDMYFGYGNEGFYLPINGFTDDGGDFVVHGINFADWLSTTATIICLCAICFFLFLFVRWLFRLTAGLISGRG